MKFYPSVALLLVATAATAQVTGPDDALFGKEIAHLRTNVNDYKQVRDSLVTELKNLPASSCNFKTSLDFDALLGCYGTFIRINSLSRSQLQLISEMHSRITLLAKNTTSFSGQMAGLLELSSSNNEKLLLPDISEKSLKTAGWIRLGLQIGIANGLSNASDTPLDNSSKDFCPLFIARNADVAEETERSFIWGQKDNDLFLMQDAVGRIRSMAVNTLKAETFCNRDFHSPLSQVFVVNRNLRALFKEIDQAKVIDLECAAVPNKSLVMQDACKTHLSSPSFLYTLHALTSQK